MARRYVAAARRARPAHDLYAMSGMVPGTFTDTGRARLRAAQPVPGARRQLEPPAAEPLVDVPAHDLPLRGIEPLEVRAARAGAGGERVPQVRRPVVARAHVERARGDVGEPGVPQHDADLALPREAAAGPGGRGDTG